LAVVLTEYYLGCPQVSLDYLYLGLDPQLGGFQLLRPSADEVQGRVSGRAENVFYGTF
jgi:hypothetical protein